MTIINDTRVVRLQRTAARTGHQHSGDERIIENTVDEIVTAADVVSLPPGSLISLQRGPAQGHTEEGSVLNATYTDIGGVAGGQTTSVSFDSEDAGASAAAIFVTELDFTATLSAAGEYAVNYKTFQIKTYSPVPTTVGSRIQVTYTWAPIREFLVFSPEDLIPDLEAFGDGPHEKGGDGYDLIDGCGITIETSDGYKEISVDVQALAGSGLGVTTGPDGCDQLFVDLDAYGEGCKLVHKFGSDAEDPDIRSVFSTDGYTFPIGEDRLLVTINGLMQFAPTHYTETSNNTIKFVCPLDPDDEVFICIMPGALGSGGSDDTLQTAYNNSPSGAKSISAGDGQVTITQTQATGSALRLISSGSVTPTLVADQDGSGEAFRLKSNDETNSTILVQKDAASRDSILDTVIIERTTTHINGGLDGIGSAILTRLEDSGGNLFDAARISVAAEDASDSTENAYISFELIEDGSVEEKARLTSTGSLGINTTSPSALLHTQGDGYFSDTLEVAGKISAGTDDVAAPFNAPVFGADPSIIEDGDIWITDIGGTRRINARIAGITYSVILT